MLEEYWFGILDTYALQLLCGLEELILVLQVSFASVKFSLAWGQNSLWRLLYDIIESRPKKLQNSKLNWFIIHHFSLTFWLVSGDQKDRETDMYHIAWFVFYSCMNKMVLSTAREQSKIGKHILTNVILCCILM